MRLNQAAVDRESYTGKSYIDANGREQWPPCTVWDEDVPGFGMRIHPPSRGVSRKEFVFTYTVGARARVMVLGTYQKNCTLKEARRVASEALALSRRGVDPIEARQSTNGFGGVEDLALRFLEQHTAAGARRNLPGGS
jgi:hypothetical protein